MTLSYLGQALWLVGETQEGVEVLREAARASLAAATRDVRLSLWGYSRSEPISIARIQCAISDREGAVATLRGVLNLAAPLEYEPPPPPPADLRPGMIYIAGPPTLKPAAKRWLDARPELVGVLARAGLDAEAFSFLTVPNAKQLDLLGRILRGQAERGAFAAAFQTLGRLQKEPLTTEAEPSKVILKPTGEISVEIQKSPVRAVEDLERTKAFRTTLWSIIRNTARLGDVDAFKRADLMWRQQITEDPSQFPRRDLGAELKMFAKAGQVRAAMEFAQAAPSFGGRVAGLLKVVEGLAGVPEPLDNPFFP
jgi:hypothetical protein